MRIVERYSGRMRLFMGRGAWSLLAPLRSFISLCHGLYRGMNQPASPAQPPVAGAWIISVGNIEVGGGGKTPCVLAIARALRAGGLERGVGTRGSGGTASGWVGVVTWPWGGGGQTGIPAGYEAWSGGSDEDAAALMGDEAVLYLAENIPLVIDADRVRGIEVATRVFSPTHVILDDAFQRTSLPKDLDILLLDARRPFGSGSLLPAGTLREPPSAASRAGAIVFTRAEGEEIPPEAARVIEGKPVFFARHLPVALRRRDGEAVEPRSLSGSRVVLFSGIARPGSFEKTAVEFGLDPVVSYRFDDHHRYSREDVEGMIGECGSESVFVTTGKDWSKAAVLFPEGADLLRLDVEMEIREIRRLLEPVLGVRAGRG